MVMEVWRMERDIGISAGVLCSAATMWAMFRTSTWSKRSGRVAIDSFTLAKFITISCGLIANVFLLVNAAAAINYYFLYKYQTTEDEIADNHQASHHNYTIPRLTPSEEYPFKVYMIIALVLKCVQVLHEITLISMIDIFFIDWERPKKGVHFPTRPASVLKAAKSLTGHEDSAKTLESIAISGRTLSAPETNGNQSSTDLGSLTGNLGSRSSINSAPKIGGVVRLGEEKAILNDFPNVTIWRTYFVVNEWLRICSLRRLSTGLHTLILIILVHTYQWEDFASATLHADHSADMSLQNLPGSKPVTTTTTTTTSASVDDELHGLEIGSHDTHPHAEHHTHEPVSVILRLAIGTVIYVGLALAQIAFKRWIYEPFVYDRVLQFVDLCSVSNISVLGMIERRYGFYLHGKNPNGRSDANMKEMHEQLMREENDLCSKRGLVPDTEQQSFEVSLPAAINEQYHRLRSMLTAYSQASDRMQNVGGRLGRVDIEKVVPAYHTINKFLAAFLEHEYQEMDYSVLDKKALECILDTEFTEERDKAFFYNDNGKSFTRAMLLVLELTLLSWELMLFIVIDFIATDFTTAAIVVYFISQCVKGGYMSATRKNLVRKALVDERFLI